MPIPAIAEEFLAQAITRTRADSRLLGLAAGGSYLRGEMDQHSDLDLVLVGRDADYPELMRGRTRLAESLGTLLSGFTGEHVGEPRVLICLYGPPLLHVDLKFVALADFGARVEDPAILWERDTALSKVIAARPSRWPVPDPQWIEDRFWVWVHYVTTKLERGELFETLKSLTEMRSLALGPLAMLAEGRPAQGVRRLEATRWAAALRETIASYDARSCAGALHAIVGVYRELRERIAAPGLVRRAAAETEVMRFLESVAGRAGVKS